MTGLSINAEKYNLIVSSTDEKEPKMQSGIHSHLLFVFMTVRERAMSICFKNKNNPRLI